MIDAGDVYLDKARPADWEAMYRNVWSQPESARYMFWELTVSEEGARARMQRTIGFQAAHDTYLVYEKAAGEAIGWAGLEEAERGVCQERDICLGPAYVRRGYGTQILTALLRRAREQYHAREFRCRARADNAATAALLKKLGFRRVSAQWETSFRDGTPVEIVTFSRPLEPSPKGGPSPSAPCGAATRVVSSERSERDGEGSPPQRHLIADEKV